jgi:hypothetical protein
MAPFAVWILFDKAKPNEKRAIVQKSYIIIRITAVTVHFTNDC